MPCKALCGFAAHVGKSDGRRAPRTPEGIQRAAALHQMQRRPYSVLECWSCRLSRRWTFNGGPERCNSRMPCSISLAEKGFWGFAAHLRAFPCPLEAIHPAPPNAIATFRGYGSRPQDSDMQRSRLNACCLLRFGAERALVEALLSCYNKNTKAGAILL